MLSANAIVHITFTAKCPNCKHESNIEDNWDIDEGHPLMQGMIDRFTKDTETDYPPLISKGWIENATGNGYKNPYACKNCGANFEIKRVDW